tara:strand:+ start:1629 stop:1841 length:213 start_codon:yes stop_codon:yes gene_type:complete
MSTITCTGCGQKFEGDAYGDSPDFDMHECTAVLEEVLDGESFDDFVARCNKKLGNPPQGKHKVPLAQKRK